MRLDIKDLTLKHGDKILLDNINFYIESHDITILLGSSGSGKTLTTLSIQGLIPNNLVKTSGIILLDNKEIETHKARGKIFANIMQNPRTCFNQLYTMKSHIKESIKAINVKWNEKYIESTLKEVGLDISILNLYPFEMSGGMLQRVMIALALLTKAPFIIADEPTTDLDLITQYKILKILKRLQTQKGLGILLITHDIEVASKIASKIIVIENGKMHEEFKLTPKIQIHEVKHEYSKRLVNRYLNLLQAGLKR